MRSTPKNSVRLVHRREALSQSSLPRSGRYALRVFFSLMSRARFFSTQPLLSTRRKKALTVAIFLVVVEILIPQKERNSRTSIGCYWSM